MRSAFLIFGLVQITACMRDSAILALEEQMELNISAHEGHSAKAHKPLRDALADLVNKQKKTGFDKLINKEAQRLYESHWITSQSDLDSLDDEAWHRLRLPLGIRRELFELRKKTPPEDGPHPRGGFSAYRTLRGLFSELAQSLQAHTGEDAGVVQARYLERTHWLKSPNELYLFRHSLGLLRLPEKLLSVLKPNLQKLTGNGKECKFRPHGAVADDPNLYTVATQYAADCEIYDRIGVAEAVWRHLRHSHWLEKLSDLKRVCSISRSVWDDLELPVKIRADLAERLKKMTLSQPNKLSVIKSWMRPDLTIDAVVHQHAKPPFDGDPSNPTAQEIVLTFRNHWLFKLGHLTMLTDEQWGRLKVPAKLRYDLREVVRSMSMPEEKVEISLESWKKALARQEADSPEMVAYRLRRSPVEKLLLAAAQLHGIDVKTAGLHNEAAARLKENHWITNVHALLSVGKAEWADLGLPMLIEDTAWRLVDAADAHYKAARKNWATKEGITDEREMKDKFLKAMQGTKGEQRERDRTRRDAVLMSMNYEVVIGWFIRELEALRQEGAEVDLQVVRDRTLSEHESDTWVCADGRRRADLLKALDLVEAEGYVKSYLGVTDEAERRAAKEELEKELKALLAKKVEGTS